MKKIFGILSIFLGFELLVCFVVCLFIPVPRVVVKSSVFLFRILSGIELFIKFLPAVIMTGYVVSFSIFFGHNSEGSFVRFSPRMKKRFKTVMIISIIVAAVLTLNTEVFGNIVKRRKLNIINQPKIISEYVNVGNNLFKNGYYDRAIRYADAALKLSPNNAAALNLRDKSEVEINKSQNSDIREKLYTVIEEADDVEKVIIDAEKISEVYKYYLKAQEEYDNEHWINAHYYAEQGIQLATSKDPNLEKLKIISTSAWNKLSDSHKMEKTEGQDIFMKKYEGYRALLEHDDLKAYYIFRELFQSSRELQSDPDVNFYMEIAEDRINHKSFFIDETLELESFESANDVYFSYKYPDGSVDLFYCKGITIVQETGMSIQYLRDLIIVSLQGNGDWFKTMYTPYAKVSPVAVDKLGQSTKDFIGISDDIETLPYFILKSVGRDDAGSEILPQYVYSNGEKASSPEYLLLPISYDYFTMLENSTHNPETIPILTLCKLAFNASDYGYSTEVFAQVLINRIYFPLMIIIIFIFLATFAWHNRIELDESFKIKWVFGFPFLFFIGVYFYKGVLFVFKLLNYAILGKMPVSIAFIVAGVFYFIIFIIVSLCFMGSKAGK